MREVPRYLRVRLAEVTPGDAHPDADLLSAFAERSLAQDERRTVMAHLGACADCRHVLMLSLPDLSPETTGSRHLRRHFPLMRWGFVAAAMSAVALAALLLLPGRQQSPVYLARSASVAVAPAAERPPSDAENHTLAESRVKPEKQSGFGAASAMTRLQLSAGEAKAKKDRAQDERGEAALPARGVRQSNAPVVAELTAPAAPAPSTVGGMAAATARMDVAAKTAMPAQWTVRDGALLRSQDGGATWQPAAVSPGAKLLAVAAVASELWAAAPGRLLYHSSDAGGHWEALLPGFADAASPAGEVVRLDFTDAQHGRASLSQGETWLTANGGRSWQKQ
jgi:hypothetical protein